MQKLIFIIFIGLFSHTKAQNSATLIINVKNIKNDSGSIFVTVKDSNKKIVQQKTVTISDNSAQIIFTKLTNGKYAVNLFHDKNSNGKLDTDIFGMPKEGWGVSNDAKGNLGPPKFEDMIFNLDRDLAITIHVNN